jgi:hypothetical protein
MEVTMQKCEICGFVTESLKEYKKHMKIHGVLEEIDKQFPHVKDRDSRFVNGERFVQRDKNWLDSYKRMVEKAVLKSMKTDCELWSYGWFRSLNDGQSMIYGHALRALNVCPICYKEWGQLYFRNKCMKKCQEHQEKEKEYEKELNA